MEVLRKVTRSLLGAAILFFYSTAAQSPVHATTAFLPNIPSSQILSRELEAPFSNNFVPNSRFLPQPNPQPPVTTFRQTIFTPNIRHDERSGIATVQNFPSINRRVPLPLQLPQTSLSNFQTSFVNFQNNHFTNNRDFTPQFNPLLLIQRSPQQRLPGNVNFGTPLSQTAPRTSLPTHPFSPEPTSFVNSPSPVTAELQRDTVLPQQPITVQQQRDAVPLRGPPTPTQRISVSRAQFSSNNGRPLSYSSDLNDSSSANAPGPAVEILPPVFEEISRPTIAKNFSPAFVNPSSNPSLPPLQNRFTDVSTQVSSSPQVISQQGGSPTQSRTVELPIRNSLASGRLLNNFVSFGQTNQISQPEEHSQRMPFNPAVNILPTSADLRTDSPLSRPGLPVELLPPPASQDSQDGEHLPLQPTPVLVESQRTPVLQEQRAGQANFMVNQGEEEQTVKNPLPEGTSSGLPTPPTSPTVSNEVPPAEPQSAFHSLKLSDFKIETIHPIIQEIITGIDRTPSTKDSSFLKTVPPALSLDLQPPSSPDDAPLLSPIVIDFSSQTTEKPFKTSGGITRLSGSPAPIGESPFSAEGRATAKSQESSPGEILSSVLTFSTPLPSVSADQPETTDSRLPPNSFATTTTAFPSTPNITQTTVPTRPPLSLDLEPPEDKVPTPPLQPQKEQNVFLPPPVSEGFVIFQNPQATAPTNQSTAPSTLTVTNQGATGVIKPQEASKVTIPTDLQTPSLPTRPGIPSSQTIQTVPQIEQGSIFPTVNIPIPSQSPSLSPNTSSLTVPLTESILSFDSEATSKPQAQIFTSLSSEKSSPSTQLNPKKEPSEDPKSSKLSAELLPPFSNNVNPSPFLPLFDDPGVSGGSSPFNFTTKVITNVSFSATHGPGTPCVRLDLRHKGYRAPQFGGNLLLSPGFYPADNVTNETAQQCGRIDIVDGRKFNWWQILLNHGGEPSALNGSSASGNSWEQPPTVKNPCIRPFETEGVPTYYNHTGPGRQFHLFWAEVPIQKYSFLSGKDESIFESARPFYFSGHKSEVVDLEIHPRITPMCRSSDLENFYREEVAYHRFPGTPHTFLESRGLIVWRPTNTSRNTIATPSSAYAYLLRYTRDDTGFWLEVNNVDCQFDKSDQPNLKCYSVPECSCSSGTERACSVPVLVLQKNISDDAKV